MRCCHCGRGDRMMASPAAPMREDRLAGARHHHRGFGAEAPHRLPPPCWGFELPAAEEMMMLRHRVRNGRPQSDDLLRRDGHGAAGTRIVRGDERPRQPSPGGDRLSRTPFQKRRNPRCHSAVGEAQQQHQTATVATQIERHRPFVCRSSCSSGGGPRRHLLSGQEKRLNDIALRLLGSPVRFPSWRLPS